MRSRPTLAMAMLAGLMLVAPVVAAAEGDAQPYIVVLRDSAVSTAIGSGQHIDSARVAQLVDQLTRRQGVSVSNVFDSALGGFSAHLNPAQVSALAADPSVASVTPDVAVTLSDGPRAAEYVVSLADPKVPAGIRRIGANQSDIANINGKDGRVDVDVAVIDTGIEASHPDLNVVGGYNCTSSNRDNWNDGNGHGTHVAGTIGALDNGRGVVGVAPGARLWAIKVLDNTGNGLMSWIVCGIDWITSKRSADGTRPRIEVANMSLRANLPSGGNDHNCGHTIRDSLHAAICRSVAAGTVYVVAAGNDRQEAANYRPAAYEEVITVSAMTDYDGKPGGLGSRPAACTAGYPDDTWAGFSNYGNVVDLTAPGICVLSTWAGKQYAYASGTSMASPHVAGVAALYKVRYPNAHPQQVRMALQYTGHTDWKKWTDPDGSPDTMVWATDFAPPPNFDIGVNAPSGYAGADSDVAVAVSIDRTNGHSAPVTLTISGLPPAITAAPVTTTKGSATIDLHVAGWAASGHYTVTVDGDDGELARSASFDLAVDTDPPTASFDAPSAPARMQQSTSAKVSWTESDHGGSGIVSRTLWRQRSSPSAPGDCTGTDYYDIGYPRTAKSDYTDSLYSGYCYRWSLSLRDKAGNRTTIISGTVLVDTTAPSKPSATVAGSSSSVVPLNGLNLPSAYVAGDGTVWLRGGGSGSVDLLVQSSDSQSGVASISLTTGTSTSGWTLPKSPLKGGSATAHLAYAAKAVALSLTLRATNGAGERGDSRTLKFAPDSVAPSPASWTHPSSSLSYSWDGEVTLNWTGGSDGGSGLASSQVVRRQRAPVSAGACGTFDTDGSWFVAANGNQQTGLQSGYCYRWKLRTTDRVGNLAPSVYSGKVLIDTVAPKISIDKPVPGSTIVKSTTAQTVSWSASDSGGSRLAAVKLQRQRSGTHSAGSCANSTWKNDGTSRELVSPIKETGLLPGSCYRWVITATDNATNRTVATTGSVLISGAATASEPSTSAPTVSALSVVPESSVQLTSTGMIWLDARWSASGGGATLTGYELRLSSSGGTSWSTYTTPNGSVPQMSLRLPAGRTYLIEVRARNSLGIWSDWSAPRTFALSLAQAETSSAFEKVGAWKSLTLSGASGGAVTYSTASGAIIRYHFTGRSVALVASTGPDRGRADVYVDGLLVTTIDLYSSTLTTRKVVFTRNWSTSGSHVVSLQIHTTTDRPRVDLDAAVVLN
jgi:subtilisin